MKRLLSALLLGAVILLPAVLTPSSLTYTYHVGRVCERYALSIDFVVGGYSRASPALEIRLSKHATLKVFATSGPEPMPGVYLEADGKALASAVLLLHPSNRYRLILTANDDFFKAGLAALDGGWLADPVRRLPPLYKQGLAFGSGLWYFTGTSILIKLDREGEVLDFNSDPIPSKLKKEGYFHLGDPDYWNGTLYVPVERRGYLRPAVLAAYNPTTLELARYSYTPQDHMPWVAVDKEGRLYTSEYSPVDEVLMYRAEDIGEGGHAEPIRKVRLNRTLDGVQGGAFYDGKLYLSVMDGWIYEVDPGDGGVRRAFQVPNFYEMEGIEVLDEGGRISCYVLVNTGGDWNMLYCYVKVPRGFRKTLLTVKEGLPTGPSIKVRVNAPTSLLAFNFSSLPPRP